MRAGISVFAQIAAAATGRAVAALAADLRSGAWQEQHRGLLERTELELGYYVVVAGD